jgi:hypothetical protein
MERAAAAAGMDGGNEGGLRVPVSPRLRPAGSPGPVTPWELDGEEKGVLGRGG